VKEIELPPHDSAPQCDDYELMQRIAGGDAAALATLYDRHAPLVQALCLRIVRDRGAAEDLVVDFFWEIWQRGQRYDAARGAPMTYLLTVARSRALDRLRSSDHRAATLDGQFAATDNAQTQIDATDPAAGLVSGENRDLVRKALASLESVQREAIELSFYDGLSHSEIAAKLDKPLGTVKTHIRQGLIRLRETLRNQNE
jgi:RNA polymerase sigma-70 factor, ECF subfamily